MTYGDQFRPAILDSGLDRVRLKDAAPLRLDGDYVGTHPAPDLDLEVAEAAEDRHFGSRICFV